MPKLTDMHLPPSHPPLAYFITVGTYGTRLHGDDRLTIDRNHNTFGTPRVPPNPAKLSAERDRLKHPPTILTPQATKIVEQTIREVCTHRLWHLFDVAARTTHFHAIITAPVTAERVMNDLKAYATRRLREAALIPKDHQVWAQHGSTPHLYTNTELAAAIDYVHNRQGPPLQPRDPRDPQGSP